MVHGQQTPKDDFQPPQLTGVPPGLQQMIAVSDASDGEAHPFVYLWADPADADKMKEQMEIAAAQRHRGRGTPGEDHSQTAHAATTAAQRRRAAAAAPPASQAGVYQRAVQGL